MRKTIGYASGFPYGRAMPARMPSASKKSGKIVSPPPAPVPVKKAPVSAEAKLQAKIAREIRRLETNIGQLAAATGREAHYAAKSGYSSDKHVNKVVEATAAVRSGIATLRTLACPLAVANDLKAI